MNQQNPIDTDKNKDRHFRHNPPAIPNYTSDLAEGTLCLAAVSILHPAQASLGYREVDYRIQQFKAMIPQQLDAYLRENFLPVAIAPNRLPYVVDHHHRARAIEITGLRQTVYVKVLTNCSDRTQEQFWQVMKDRAWVYLYDQEGNPIQPENIPSHLADLADDKYRSLAWAVRMEGGYQKSSVPFQEFLWGNYFRQCFTFENTEQGFRQAVTEALTLCRLPQASHLPGYSG